MQVENLMKTQKYLISYVKESIGLDRFSYHNEVINHTPVEWVMKNFRITQSITPRKYTLLNAIPISDEESAKYHEVLDL